MQNNMFATTVTVFTRQQNDTHYSSSQTWLLVCPRAVVLNPWGVDWYRSMDQLVLSHLQAKKLLIISVVVIIQVSMNNILFWKTTGLFCWHLSLEWQNFNPRVSTMTFWKVSFGTRKDMTSEDTQEELTTWRKRSLTDNTWSPTWNMDFLRQVIPTNQAHSA